MPFTLECRALREEEKRTLKIDVSYYTGIALILPSGLKSLFPKKFKYTNEDIKINFINYLGICLEEANRVKYPVTQMHQILYSGSLLKSESWACPAIGSLDRKAYEFLWFMCYFCCCSSSAPVF